MKYNIIKRYRDAESGALFNLGEQIELKDQKRIKGFFPLLVFLYLMMCGISIAFYKRLGLMLWLPIDDVGKLLLIVFSLAMIVDQKYLFSSLGKIRVIKFVLLYTVILLVISSLLEQILELPVPFSPIKRSVEQFSGFVLAIVAGYYAGRVIVRDAVFAYKAIQVSLVLMGLGVVFQAAMLGSQSIFLYRLFGLSYEPKVLGASLVPLFIAYMSVAGERKKASYLLLLILALIILTKSATAIVSLVVMIVLYTWISKRGLGKFFYISALSIIGIVFFVSLSIILPEYGEALFLRIVTGSSTPSANTFGAEVPS